MDIKKLWDSVLAEIELIVSQANFKMWFKDTAIAKIEDGVVYLNVPNIFVRDWLHNKFHKSILKYLRNAADIRAVEYIVVKEGRDRPTEPQKVPIWSHNSELPLNDYYINKDDNLNPRYTFESLVVGPFNELAYAGAQAVVKRPGAAYNPLFIYGETGRGKTHLIQAIGNYLKASTNKKIYYVTSERFTIDYINSVQNERANSFKEKYRSYDVIIMDDVQFLAKTEKSQEELFHLFNTLYENNKQIVFSSDKHPNYISPLESRLRSRFNAGMTIDISSPDFESRAAILRAKSALQHFELSQEMVDFLATNIEGNVRELEGILNSVIMQSQMKGKELTINDAKNLIKNNVKPQKNIAMKDVVKTIAGFYNIDEATIYEKTRRRKEVVKPRQLIMYILREEFDISYPSIGQKLGGRDHTTVIHSCEKIKRELKTNQLLVEELKQIKSMF